MFKFIKEATLSVADKLKWLAPLLARLVIGAVFIPTGWGKLHNLGQITEYFKSLGIPAAEIQAPFVSTVELVCGGMILAGLFSRLAALPLIGTMVVAILTAKMSGFTGLLDVFSTQEFDYIVMLVVIFVMGAGRLSIDQLICKECAGTQKS